MTGGVREAFTHSADVFAGAARASDVPTGTGQRSRNAARSGATQFTTADAAGSKTTMQQNEIVAGTAA